MPTLSKPVQAIDPDFILRQAERERYINHEECTDEELAFQLGFKPHEDEYFGIGYQYTNNP